MLPIELHREESPKLKLVDPTGLKPAPHGLKGRRSVTRAPSQDIADFRLPIANLVSGQRFFFRHQAFR